RAFVSVVARALRTRLGGPLRRFGRFAATAQVGELVERDQPLTEGLHVVANRNALGQGGLEIGATLIERRLHLVALAGPRVELVVELCRPRLVLTGCLDRES